MSTQALTCIPWTIEHAPKMPLKYYCRWEWMWPSAIYMEILQKVVHPTTKKRKKKDLYSGILISSI